MNYSARQLRCLDAMGLVAWTDKRSVVNLPVPVQAAPGQAAPAQSSPAEEAPKQSALVKSHDCAALSQWLVEQPLLTFASRGNNVYHIGSDQASLLVVCIHDEGLYSVGNPALPLPADCASLFGLMMRAIELPNRAIRQCVMHKSPDVAAPGNLQAEGLQAAVTPVLRGILVLDVQDQWHEAGSEADTSTLPGSALPVWRIPHPQMLLNQPWLKRCAWENLKAMKPSITLGDG